MSGGSYDYLCYRDAEQLFEKYWNSCEQLEEMADRLAGLGYADDAAKETLQVLLIMRQARNHLDTRAERLSGVWKAVEWWDSADSSESAVEKALAEYRAAILPQKEGAS